MKKYEEMSREELVKENIGRDKEIQEQIDELIKNSYEKILWRIEEMFTECELVPDEVIDKFHKIREEFACKSLIEERIRIKNKVKGDE